MNVELEYVPDIVLQKVIVPEVLEIKKDHINLLGTQFLVLINEEGNFTRIKNILLDESSSFKLTELLWNFAFVHLTVQRSRGQFGHTEIGIKIKNILNKILRKLIRCRNLCDITILIQYMERKGTHINSLL
jgi:hypothetical protein